MAPRRKAATAVYLLTGAAIYTPDEVIVAGAVLVERGLIRYVGPAAGVVIPAGARVLELSGKTIIPGLIDLHLHGARGRQVMEGTDAALDELLEAHLCWGTTSVLASTMSASHRKLVRLLTRLAQYSHRQSVSQGSPQSPGAQLLGVHLEGPYLSPEQAGVHPRTYLRPPSIAELEEYRQAAQGLLRIVTLAPELPGTDMAIRWLRERGIMVSLGHTQATYRQARAAIAAGAGYATHTFNAMRAFHHREPGVVGALLTNFQTVDQIGREQNVYLEVIADGHHLHPATLVLVTDASPLSGLSPGKYETRQGRFRVTKDKVTTPDGRLAGSGISLLQAVFNMQKYAGCSFTAALGMATINPARVLGLDRRRGRLAVGYRADLVVLASHLQVNLVMMGGEICYRAG